MSVEVRRMARVSRLLGVAAVLALGAVGRGQGVGAGVPGRVVISDNWLMQDVAQVKARGEEISAVGFQAPVYVPGPYAAPATAKENPPTATAISDAVRYVVMPRVNGNSTWPVNPEKNRPNTSSGWVQAPGPGSANWYTATVPGTVLTTLVNNNIYPEPLYGENNRPNIIPESLCRTSYWYRTEMTVPAGYAGRKIWLNFEGINYAAEVWVNGKQAGTIKGAFIRGNFDITALVKPGEKAALAVLISPPPHPGDPWEKTVANQRGPNGGGVTGPLGQDGPTFVAAIGWDWVPGIRDRQIGIWQDVSLSATGAVVLKNPFVTTDLPLPKTDSADVAIEVTAENTSSVPQTGVLAGTLGEIKFASAAVTVAPMSSQKVVLNPANTPALRVANPKLWWPNGFGEPNLYPLHLSFDIGGGASDVKDLNVGIRKVSYFVEGSNNLTLSVNGVKVFAKGGNWGMDEALKRIPRERLEAQIKMHKLANYTILRNWVGQSTTEDLYDLCDKYGIMVWDEFFQANPNNGMDPIDGALYLSNVRDKVLRFRNHPSIVVWCGRNEGPPPPAINAGNAAIIKELDTTRYYQSSSTAGNGVVSGGGGYGWRTPRQFYGQYPVFNTEVGSASIPTLEAIQSWMPEKDWFDQNFPNDDWATHDLVTGNGSPANFPFHVAIAKRYGAFKALPDFVRKSQMADYEAFRAMYEARMSRMFDPCTAIITWMSNPAQPCLVWQIYDYSLEPFGSFFGVEKACEPVHILMTQDDFRVVVVNHGAKALRNMRYRVRVYNLDGAKKLDQTLDVPQVAASSALMLGAIAFPGDVSPVHFVKLELLEPAKAEPVSENFYWRETVQDDLTALDQLPDVQLTADVRRRDEGGKCVLTVTLSNPAPLVAVMAHVQLRNGETGKRVLPVFYSDNYVSILPGERKTVTIEAAVKDVGRATPEVAVDGWNVTVAEATAGGVKVKTNANAHVMRGGPVK